MIFASFIEQLKKQRDPVYLRWCEK